MSLQTINIGNKIYVSLNDYIDVLNKLNDVTQEKLELHNNEDLKEELTKNNEHVMNYFSSTDITNELDTTAAKLNDFLCGVEFLNRVKKKKSNVYTLNQKYEGNGYEIYVTSSSPDNQFKFKHLKFTLEGKQKILELYNGTLDSRNYG